MPDDTPSPAEPAEPTAPNAAAATEPRWRRTPVIRFGLPFAAIALIGSAILWLSGLPGSKGDEAGSAELRAARLGAIGSGIPEKGQPAPDFALRSLDGATIRLSELRGRPVLINFWATWCGPCRAEMPELQAVYAQEKDDLVILAVNVEGTSVAEARRLARDFRDELGLTFPILLDSPDGAVFQQYRLRGLPDSFFVDKDGIVRDVSFGPMSRDTIQKKLQITRRLGS